jgi:hypothetical protein
MRARGWKPIVGSFGAALLAIALAQPALARSEATRRAFQRQHPCPSTHLKTGSCPGWIMDHVVPLCAGGPDTPENMQWQTVHDAKIKDVEERRMCRRKPPRPAAVDPRV